MSAYRTYSFPEAKNIVVCGDIHGAFNALIFLSCIRYQMTDTLIIVAGDCGFGFEEPGYYDSVYKRNASRLSQANNWVVMVRGNHDDPVFFREERISHERFRCVPDYSVIQVCDHTILCVGGAVSIDRAYRKTGESGFLRPDIASYWVDEMPVFNELALDEISQNFKIDTVITHTAPSFCELSDKAGLAPWATMDPEIPADCGRERKTMDQIHAYLKSSGHPLSRWYYGHFHKSWCSEIDGVLYSMLDIMEFKDIP